MQKILIIGATSAIAESVARLYAARGAALYLVGRSGARLDAIAADLRVRGAPHVHSGVLDEMTTSGRNCAMPASSSRP